MKAARTAGIRRPFRTRDLAGDVAGRAAAQRSRRRPTDCAGFTLIEIMVAMTILVVLVGGVYVCFASVADTADFARTASDELRIKQFIWNHVRDQLASISAKTDGEYALVGEDESGTYGDADTLRFVTSLPMAGAKSLPGITKVVEYYIDDPSLEDASGFTTFDDGALEDEREGATLFISETPLVLLPGGEGELFPETYEEEDEDAWIREVPIRSINIEYYDGAAEEWIEDWNSDELGLLPWAIKVQINLAKTEEQIWAEASAGVDPREDFDLEMTVVLPTGAGTLAPFLDPNHYRSTDQEAEEVGAGNE
jgi:prepilin-type N-terminal cleavage/methylation domain-containing protein